MFWRSLEKAAFELTNRLMEVFLKQYIRNLVKLLQLSKYLLSQIFRK